MKKNIVIGILAVIILMLSTLLVLEITGKTSLFKKDNSSQIGTNNSSKISEGIIATHSENDKSNEIKIEYYIKKCLDNDCLNYDEHYDKIPLYKIEQHIYLNGKLLEKLIGTVKYIYDEKDYLKEKEELEKDWDFSCGYLFINDNYMIFRKFNLDENLPQDGQSKIYIYNVDGTFVDNITVQDFVSISVDGDECAGFKCKEINYDNGKEYLKYGYYFKYGIMIKDDWIYYLQLDSDSKIYIEKKSRVNNGKLETVILNKYSKNDDRVKVGIMSE